MDAIKSLGIGAWSLACDVLARREREMFSDPQRLGANPFLPSLRIALVKQSTYSDLYSNPAAVTVRELIESSWHRTGPVGLFTEFDGSFFIVHPEPDAECKVWEEKIGYAVADPKRAAADAHRRAVQSAAAVDADSVDWSSFDLVIAIECAIPARITRRHPSVLWTTMLEHHRMRPYTAWLRQPPDGYDAFLNLRYGPNPESILRRRHVIDWPYNFAAPGGLRRVMEEVGAGRSSRERLKVLVEDNQPGTVASSISKAGHEPVAGRRTTLREYLSVLLDADVIAFPSPTRPLGGLTMLDAASVGVLLAGNRRALWNPFLVAPELHVSSEASLEAALTRIAADRAVHENSSVQQNARLAWFGFHRPLRQLARVVRRVDRSLAAEDKIAAKGQN